VGLAALMPWAQAQYDPAVEYAVKGKLLPKLASYIQWAPEALGDPAGPFVIGILGQDPWQGGLSQLVGDKVHGRRIEIRLVAAAKLNEAQNCHLLFITKSEKDRLPQILEALARAKVCTVAETERRTKTDAVITLYVEDSIKFSVNEEAEERAKLVVPSELKDVADKVYRKRK
jgi:hypothetical protein